MMNANRDAETGAALHPCPSCRTPMPEGLRFCRMCGFRLGEGVEEYTATRRFDAKPSATATAAAPTNNLNAGAAFNMPGTWGAVAPVAPTDSSLEGRSAALTGKLARVCNPLRLNWIVWLIVLLAVLTAGTLGVQKATRTGRFRPPPPPHAYLEADDFDTADGGGAMLEGLASPNSSLERAGLRGGDIVVSLDGQKVEDEDDIYRILRGTPIGKTIEVVFVRDGVTRTTTLTTVSREESQAARRALGQRPGGEGRIGVDDLERVRVPNTNTYGVRIDDVSRNNPADIAGIKEGDIVIEFNGHVVSTPGDLRLRIYEAVPGTLVDAVVVRGGEQIKIPVKIGRSRDE